MFSRKSLNCITTIKTDMSDNVMNFAVVFVVLFIVGGIVGSLSLPEFEGKFFISGFVFAVFGTGAGNLILKKG